MARRSVSETRYLLREQGIYNDYNLMAAAGTAAFIAENHVRYWGPETHRDGWAVVTRKPPGYSTRPFPRQPGVPWREADAAAFREAVASQGGEWERSPFGGYHPAGTVARVLTRVAPEGV